MLFNYDHLCYNWMPANADVAELVDALDLGSSFFGSEGSSPFIRIKLTLQQSIITLIK